MFINIDNTGFNNTIETIIDNIVPLLSALIGGAMAFWGTHWKTKQEMEEKRKDERRDNAMSISTILASLQMVVARDTTIPFPNNTTDQ